MEQEVCVKKSIIGIIKGVLVGVTATLIFILLFSLLIKLTNMNQGFIMPMNQVIKMLAIFLGVIVCIRENRNRGLLKGILIGLLISLINYLVFSILSKEWVFNFKTLLDLFLSCAMGGISGIIAVNLKKG